MSEILKIALTHTHIEDAERLISALRNRGVAIRPKRPENVDDFKKMVNDKSVDVVAFSGDGSAISLNDTVDVIKQSGMDVGLVVSMTKPDRKLMTESHQLGVTRIAFDSIEGHTETIILDTFLSVMDRRKLREMNGKLRESERRCDSLIDSSREPIAYIHEGMYIRANQAYLDEFGYESFEDLEPMPVLDMVAPSHADAFKALLKQMSKGELPDDSFELTARKSDGEAFQAVMDFAEANFEGESCIQIMIRQQMGGVDPALLAQMTALRDFDQVSGLHNRSFFLGKLEEAVTAAQQGTQNQALLLIEIDNFDTLEREIGLSHTDELITACAGRIKTPLPESALSARLYDDSFAVLLQDSDHEATRALGQQILEAFKARIFDLSSKSLTISASIGAVQMGERNADTRRILDRAEECLSTSQKSGGNQITLHDPGAKDRAELEREQALVNRVKEAIQNDLMILHYQPVISLRGHNQPFYEGLLRMKGPEDEVIQPETFLTTALEHGMGRDIDRWVIQRAIASIAIKKRAGEKVRLMVKLSADSLNDTTLPDWVESHLKQMKVPGEQLVIQIQESRIFTNLKDAKTLSESLHALGVLTCIDGFGIGLNPFELLKHVDAKLLKLDPSLTNALSTEEDQRERMKELMEKIQESKRITIASRVEDAGTMTQLFSNQVDFVMGLFLAGPSQSLQYDFNA